MPYSKVRSGPGGFNNAGDSRHDRMRRTVIPTREESERAGIKPHSWSMYIGQVAWQACLMS